MPPSGAGLGAIGVVLASVDDLDAVTLDGRLDPAEPLRRVVRRQHADEYRYLAAIRQELARISDEGVTPDEVQRVKNRSRTGLATEAEAPYYRLMQLAGEIDVLGAPRSVSQRLADIDAVTPERILEYLKRWPIRGRGVLVSLGPRDWPEESI